MVRKRQKRRFCQYDHHHNYDDGKTVIATRREKERQQPTCDSEVKLRRVHIEIPATLHVFSRQR